MLPFDVSRCLGVEGCALCVDCERRSTGGEWSPYIVPFVVDGRCESYMEPVRYTITEKGRRMLG